MTSSHEMLDVVRMAIAQVRCARKHRYLPFRHVEGDNVKLNEMEMMWRHLMTLQHIGFSNLAVGLVKERRLETL
jgi:hypothetical protein